MQVRLDACEIDPTFHLLVVALAEKHVFFFLIFFFSYMMFFLGEKYSVSFPTALSKSLFSPVSGRLSKMVSTSGPARYKRSARLRVGSLMSIATINR